MTMFPNVLPSKPSISVQKPGKVTFLFESVFLVLYHAPLSRNLGHKTERTSQWSSNQNIFLTEAQVHHKASSWQKLMRADTTSGQACFVCKASNKDSADLDGHADCPRCGLAVKLDWKNTQHILEHMGAHILYDVTLNSSKEQCGLCLRPAPMALCVRCTWRAVVQGVSLLWINLSQSAQILFVSTTRTLPHLLTVHHASTSL